jgi:phage-related protein
MPQSYFQFPPWNSTLNYEQFDVVYGINIASSIFYDGRYYVATQPTINHNPSGLNTFTLNTYGRSAGVATAYFTQNVSIPYFTRGSIIQLVGGGDPSYNYTGMALDGGSGFVRFQSNQGFEEGVKSSAGGSIIAPLSPAWTTGFFFTPAYSSPLDNTQSIIEAKFGDGYSQRQRGGLNSNMNSWQLNFTERSNKEARAILTMVGDKGGVEPMEIIMPVDNFSNRPNLKFTIKNPKYNPVSFGLNNISVQVDQVYDIG